MNKTYTEEQIKQAYDKTLEWLDAEETWNNDIDGLDRRYQCEAAVDKFFEFINN